MSLIISNVVNYILRVEKYLCPYYCGILDRRRVVAFLFLTLIECVIIPFHLTLFIILREPWGMSVAVLHALLFMGGQYLTWKRKVKFEKALSCFYLLVFAKLAIDCILCPIFGSPKDNASVMGNVFIMYILAVTAMAQMMKKTSLVISIGIIPVLVFYYIIHPVDEVMFSVKAFFVGFILVLYVATFNSHRFTQGLRQPSELTKEEKKALEMLAGLKDMNYDKAGNLMERLSPELRQRIVKHASEHLRKEEMDKLVWDEICQGLTNSEKEICKLVLQGFTLKQICIELDKSESNITSQRSHIRKKLNLDRKADLRRTLELRIAELRERNDNL